jgi:hypothetical protein
MIDPRKGELGAIRSQGDEQTLVLKGSLTDFRQFVTNLLGKPQTIRRTFRGSFDITTHQINDLFALIDQRVTQQNRGFLIQFTTTVVFDDDSSVLLNSLDDLNSYREVRPVTSTQVHLRWVHMVHFQDKEQPERQEIEVSFMTEFPDSRFMSEPGLEVVQIHRVVQSGSGFVTIGIKHTARTWGADIEALLSGYVKGLLEDDETFRRLIRKYSGWIGFAVWLCVFGAAMVIEFNSWSHFESARVAEAARVIGPQFTVSAKMDVLLQRLGSSADETRSFYQLVFGIGAFVIAIFLAVWASSTAAAQKPSFIVLSDTSARTRTESLRKYSRSSLSLLGALISSLGSGVLGNWLYSWLAHWLELWK